MLRNKNKSCSFEHSIICQIIMNKIKQHNCLFNIDNSKKLFLSSKSALSSSNGNEIKQHSMYDVTLT